MGYDTCGFSEDLTASSSFLTSGIESIALSKTYPENAEAYVLFDGNSRTALSFNTNENGTIDIYLSGPYVFTRVDVYAGSGPAAPKVFSVCCA